MEAVRGWVWIFFGIAHFLGGRGGGGRAKKKNLQWEKTRKSSQFADVRVKAALSP